ncbi:MAG TPA: family 10 glycosylhydrolase [Verrucomicrobia bacterium]|nr:family 10 glycosylhydrolase [Verrucomicrobiota bacterium]HOP96323.1 family 10 glycosylhydrolase [Verrucomicrobiota bacterium]
MPAPWILSSSPGRRKPGLRAIALLLAFNCSCSAAAVRFQPSKLTPPAIQQEFRGLWIATVANIDWPSRPGLSTDTQKAELISILDRAAELNLNAVIFQVRPACDAFYASSIEPWSEYLTGSMGKAPAPFYDPLAFAIAEAHKRGLELHAWFNPYRALHKSHAGSVAANHISHTQPHLVKRYGQYLWLDPGEPEVQEHSLRVVLDVVRRYDIDGVHFDDYFYPDPAESPTREPFPDQASWTKYGAKGNLSLDDWRRENVNAFIKRVHESVREIKPWVKFGVSPHGIWRPGYPSSIRKGVFDAYAAIYADSRKWLANGWVDYFSPQLYWRIDSEQSFPELLRWWAWQNTGQRHLWPGLSVANAQIQNWPADEIVKQIRITREQGRVSGFILYRAVPLLSNQNLVRALRNNLLSEKALVPASPWMGGAPPPAPTATLVATNSQWRFSWTPTGTDRVRWWIVQRKISGNWRMEILPGSARSATFGIQPEAAAIRAVDRFGNVGTPLVLEPRKVPLSPASGRRRY